MLNKDVDGYENMVSVPVRGMRDLYCKKTD